MMDMFDDILGSEPSKKPSQSDSAAFPYEMDEKGMAALLGLSMSMVRTKAREGIFVRTRPGRYDVAASVPAYVERLRAQASRIGNPSAAGDELKAEKLRLTRAQATKEEARALRERGELVEAATVSREWAGLLRDIRNALLAVPSRCGAALPHLTPTDIATLDREIRKTLEGLANDDAN